MIGDQPLTEYVPLQQKGPDQEVVTQFAMGDVEALGLLKMDFLGLRNLDVIDKAVELVGDGLDYREAPARRHEDLRDARRSGEATGVFQFESSGMREALRQVKPTEFEDLIALVALYRPGPMQYIPVYARRKNGQEPVTYIDQRLKPITGMTYGIAIYQEQYMEIAQADRRLLARRGGRPAQGDRQEDPQADGLAQGEVPRGLRAERRYRRASRSSSGRTWRRRRTTPSTSRTPPATR